MEKSVVLRSSRDKGGSRFLGATLLENGDVRIEGQDLGPGVENVFGQGYTEYEYIMTIRVKNVPALLQALGAKSDVLSALQKYFGDPSTEDPRSFLKNHNIPFEFWSRVGD